MPPADPPPDVRVVTTQLLRSWAPPEPDDGGDKHDRGTVAVVGGGTSTPGAVLLVRYVVEGLDEATVLGIDREGEVANCSVTAYEHETDAGRLRLVRYNEVAPLEEQDEPVTAEPDAPVAPR